MIDAGGEKIWLSTAKGKQLDGDRFLVLVLKLYLLVTDNVKKIAVPVQATSEVDLVAKEFGVEVVRLKDTHYSMMMACDDKDISFVRGASAADFYSRNFFMQQTGCLLSERYLNYSQEVTNLSMNWIKTHRDYSCSRKISTAQEMKKEQS